ncbi:MAG: prepilin-type N-terminal cleavage/methylation domain-containing protein [Tepidisphaeraceae bacterium]
MTKRPNSIRRAFTLTEVIMALSLLTIFFAAAGQVFHSSLMLSYDTPRSSDRASQIDSAVFQLRRDVWNSPQISVPKPTSADLQSSEGKISWTINPDGDITRTDAHGQSERWNAIGRNWSLATDGICLTMSDGGAEMRLPSQVLLTRGAHP